MRDNTGITMSSFFSRSAQEPTRLTSRPAFSNSFSSMPTITGRSKIGLLGAIRTGAKPVGGSSFAIAHLLDSVGKTNRLLDRDRSSPHILGLNSRRSTEIQDNAGRT